MFVISEDNVVHQRPAVPEMGLCPSRGVRFESNWTSPIWLKARLSDNATAESADQNIKDTLAQLILV